MGLTILEKRAVGRSRGYVVWFEGCVVRRERGFVLQVVQFEGVGGRQVATKRVEWDGDVGYLQGDHGGSGVAVRANAAGVAVVVVGAVAGAVGVEEAFSADWVSIMRWKVGSIRAMMVSMSASSLVIPASSSPFSCGDAIYATIFLPTRLEFGQMTC